jgi:(+)-trans-carveol dehydrogenase
MSARLEGKVAFITGAARGQGRSHAVRLAQEGADIIAVDICDQVDSVPFDMARPEELAETVSQVEALDRRIVAAQADVRDLAALTSAVERAVAELGRLDIVSANAGIVSYGPIADIEEQAWQDIIDINLTGVWHTVRAALPHIRAGGRGGSIVITSSTAGLIPYANSAPYVSSKHGVVGFMRTLALELAPEMIRVNTIHPTQVDTPMIMNDATMGLFLPGTEHPTREQFAAASQSTMALPIPWVDPVDISNALLFLVCDEGRYITGATLPVDAGTVIK